METGLEGVRQSLASREGESKGGRLGGGGTGQGCVCVCQGCVCVRGVCVCVRGVCVCVRARACACACALLNQCSFSLQARLLGVPGQMAFLSGPIPASVGFQVRTVLGDLGDRGGTVDLHAWRQCR